MDDNDRPIALPLAHARGVKNPPEADRDFLSKSTKHRSRDDYYDDQFEDSAPAKPPVKFIALAVILFLVGSSLLTIGSLIFSGMIGGGEGGKASPLLVIGAVCFVPGRTAY